MNRLFKLLLNCLGFATGFGIAAAIVSHFVAPRRISGVSAKLEWLHSHTADYDVLFVGSSRMKQLEPEIFNAVFAQAGMRLRSFNLAIDGVRPPEDDYLLEQALLGRKTPLRLVIVEGNRLALQISDEDFGTDRMTYWHDTKRMGTIWGRTWSNENKTPLSARESLIGYWRNFRFLPGHVQHWITNTSRIGLGHDWTEKAIGLRRTPRKSRRPSAYLGVHNDGFTPRSNLPIDYEKGIEYAKALKSIKPLGDARLDPADPASQAHFARMAAAVQSHGAQLVVVAPPTASPEVFHPLSSGIIFLDFSNPAKYPQLFDPAVRLDNSHLNDAGSKIFSRLVAEQLALVLGANKGSTGN